MTEKLTVPAWAERITVEQLPKKLFARGEGRVSNLVVSVTELRSKSQDLLAQYVPTLEWSKKRGALPPHLQFATAVRLKEQIDFVRRFGPVWGTVRQKGVPILVEQRLERLEEEQRVFALAARLLVELRKNKAAVPGRLLELVVGLHIENRFLSVLFEAGYEDMLGVAIKRAGVPKVQIFGDPNMPLTRHDHLLTEQLSLHLAHWTLCELLNRFPPFLLFVFGQRAELPRHRPEGILPMLYYMLRRDYLAEEKRVTICDNSSCGTLFAVERTNQRFCSARCSKLQRGRRYWYERGKERRRERTNR